MSKKELSGLNSLSLSQELAFSPIAFQNARCLWKLGVLQVIEDFGLKGASINDIYKNMDLTKYALGVMLDMGLSQRIITESDQRIKLTNLGFFILNDEMTQVNINFMHDVCYQAAFHLEESFISGRPEGLKVFSKKMTIYEKLSTLPNPARDSWLAFDHFYSQRSFPEALKYVFKNNPKNIMDLGGNTGKWSIACLLHCPDVHVTIVDLPGQLDYARSSIEEAGFLNRVTFHEADLLDPNSTLPRNADIVWMSQFLDCFSPLEVIDILSRVKKSLNEKGRVYIMELFVDRQIYDAAKYCLDATSLYFTFLANGNSRFYRYSDFIQFIEKSGLCVESKTEHLGVNHTLLECVSTHVSDIGDQSQ